MRPTSKQGSGECLSCGFQIVAFLEPWVGFDDPDRISILEAMSSFCSAVGAFASYGPVFGQRYQWGRGSIPSAL